MIASPLLKCMSLAFLMFISMSTTYANANQFDLGYAQCVIDDYFDGEEVRLIIEDGHLYITASGAPLGIDETQHLIKRIKRNKKIKDVSLCYQRGESLQSREGEEPLHEKPLIVETEPKSEFLPRTPLYSKPIADPRWPKFKVGYQLHKNNRFGRNIFSLAFGENVPLYQYTTQALAVEAGVQAGLFGLMDISHNPTILINSDYFVGFGLTIEHQRKWQNLLQFSHTSSHIGDELLIKNRSLIKKRINLSYEQMRWLSGYKFTNYRPYAGLGYLVHKDPASLKPFSFEYGADYLSSKTCIYNLARVVGGVHIYHWQETKYQPSITVAAGLQFENDLYESRKLRMLLEYANGHSRDGQFYRHKQQYIGIAFVLSY